MKLQFSVPNVSKASSVAGLSASKKAQRERGFSLLELAVVLSIAMILMAVAVMGFQSSRAGYRVQNDARNLASLVNAARMKAASNFSRVVVYCDPSVTPTPCKLAYFTFDSPTTAASVNQDLAMYFSPGVSLGYPSGATYGAGVQSATTPLMTSGTTNCGSVGVASPYCLIVNSRGLPASSYSAKYSSATAAPSYVFYLVDTSGNAMAVGMDFAGNATVYRYTAPTWTPLNN